MLPTQVYFIRNPLLFRCGSINHIIIYQNYDIVAKGQHASNKSAKRVEN